MTKNYFSLDEDFETIIKNALPDKKINFIKSVTTGWTNIVFEVCTNDGNYFFRFPRDDFWIRTIVKDYEFSKFIYGKTDFNTVQLKLLYDNNRPFSMHKKIEGTVLASKMNALTSEEINTISKDIAKFMFQLHQIPFSTDEVFTINNIGLKLTDFLDELLNVHVDPKDKVFWKYDEFSKKEHNCFVHGDLNSSNIILDENNHISAVIDFGFGGFGNKYFDIARIIGRCPESFKNEIIQSYENLSGENLNYPVLDDEIDIWTNIDNAYINYMRGIGIYE
ncbi:MAG: aminoglycoside phosphotransferase family protein [Clostridia bacterium]|nr:aminoglycoside phosphotransferase family protein [Clostridia bacterium]